MVSLTVYGYGLLLRCDRIKRAERNMNSIAAEEAGMHKIFSLISKELAVQILARFKSAKDYHLHRQNLYILITETTKTKIK